MQGGEPIQGKSFTLGLVIIIVQLVLKLHVRLLFLTVIDDTVAN